MKTKRLSLFLFGFAVVLFFFLNNPDVLAQTTSSNDDLSLARKYSPVLYFHSEEIFFPQPIEVLVSNARLKQDVSIWFTLNILDTVTLQDLVAHFDPSFFLDIWYGSNGESAAINYSAHRNYYIENLSPENGGPLPSVYANVIHDNKNKKIIIQYWLFYYYNDWFNKHEGDWELVQIILDQDETPEWVILSQHHGGTRRPWNEVQIEGLSHPKVFPALGSHANYFWGDEIYPNGKDFGKARVEILDRTGKSQKIIPEVILLSSELNQSVTASGKDLIKNGWIYFEGKWGEASFPADFSGPLGPAEKGILWDDPFSWGISQPLDTEVWYQNRFRIQIPDNTDSKLTIINKGNFDSAAIDFSENLIVYHQDLPQDNSMRVMLEPRQVNDKKFIIVWPIKANSIVKQLTYPLTTRAQNPIEINISSDGDIEVKSNNSMIPPTSQTIKEATWDAPDIIWVAGFLPANQVLAGIFISIFAGIFPGLVYIYLVYQVDYYEREPKTLLLATFLWGAIPAVLISLILPLYFNIPPELLGPEAIEAIRVGLFAPLIEEAIKGFAILLIAIRFRDEFDDTLDGIVYGAFVGLGFAITGNTISYIGSFLLRGFASLGSTIFVQGLLYGLNHSMYSAIFGAGLGFAKSITNKFIKRLISIFAFFLAVGINGIHSLIIYSFSKLSLWAIIINWAGVLSIALIILLSLRRQQYIIVSELKTEIPAESLEIISSRIKRRNALKATKKANGMDEKKLLDEQFQLLSELAFKKHETKTRSPEDQNLIIQALRSKIATLDQKTEFLSKFEIKN
jgi:RsiW-degrading membrane proteinase PrsW (M82 family)